MTEVIKNPKGWYDVGEWGFDPGEGDAEMGYIDATLNAWSTWKQYVLDHPEEFAK